MKIIPDTNLLIYLAKYKLLDELEHYDIVIVQQIIDELNKIIKARKSKVEDRTSAVIALDFLKFKKFKLEKQKGKADDAIISLSKKLNIAIATMDKELSSRALKQGIKIIKVRQKKYLKNA